MSDRGVLMRVDAEHCAVDESIAAHGERIGGEVAFDADGSLASLRRTDYGRLGAGGHVYLDYTGGGLYATSQLDRHRAMLEANVFGNPHSASSASLAATAEVERARRAVLAFFGDRAGEYECIFTANASGGLKLLGDAFPFGPGGAFALTADNHNSVNGIRMLARRAGAQVDYVPVVAPDLRIDRDALTRTLGRGRTTAPRLFAYPAQSNFSGVQHPLGIVAEAEALGWDVLVDAAAFVPTNDLDLAVVRPSFVVASFYKVFGHPTGVGCLLVRRDRLPILVRPWFAGGTVTIASVAADAHYLHEGAAGFEDGTVDYLNLPAVTIGLDHVARVGRRPVHDNVSALTGWLLTQLAELRHADGRPVVQVLGPVTSEQRGGTIAMVVRDRDGIAFDGRLVETLANRQRISLRSGCFCNPGAGEAALGLCKADLAPWFGRSRTVTFDELSDGMRRDHGAVLAAVRASLGIVSDLEDVRRFLAFLEQFCDRRVGEATACGPTGRRS